jgi:hypothetical protein
MTLGKAIEIVEVHNRWRKGEGTQMESPARLSEALDVVLEALKEKKNKFLIDFHEFSFLVEACIPPRPIARTMFWYDVIDKHYYTLSKEQRAHLYEWVGKSWSFSKGIEENNEDCLLFQARYNPDNQYKVTTDFHGKIEEKECFLLKDNYHINRTTSVLPEYITKIEKL